VINWKSHFANKKSKLKKKTHRVKFPVITKQTKKGSVTPEEKE